MTLFSAFNAQKSLPLWKMDGDAWFLICILLNGIHDADLKLLQDSSTGWYIDVMERKGNVEENEKQNVLQSVLLIE